MANTTIQLKFSNVTATPPSLNVAEPAYSYASNTFFIGSPSGTGAIAIGGKFYLDQQQDIYNLSNAAFIHANAAFASANNSTKANAAFDHANAAFNYANSTFVYATAAFNHANSGFNAANTADLKAVTSGTYANSAYAHANGAFNHANAGFNAANTAQVKADAAFLRANNSLDANNGGTITGTVIVVGDLDITGNVVISGNTKTIDVETLNITDPLIYLAANNYSSDLVDIGFVGNYFDGAVSRHAGLVRHAADGNFYLFTNYDEEPVNNIIDINDASFRKGTLYANLNATTVTVGGVDIKTYVDNAFNAANTADSKAVSAGNYANGAFAAANTAQAYALSAGSYANSAFSAANVADSKAVSAGSYANSAFNHANAAYNTANTDVTNVSIAAGSFGSASIVPTFSVTANGRINSISNVTIAIAASQIASGEVSVTRGGTGVASLTLNGVVLGQGTSAVTTASSSTEGHVLTINNSGVPTFAHLSGGTF